MTWLEQNTHTHTQSTQAQATGWGGGVVTVELNQITTTLWRPLVPERVNIQVGPLRGDVLPQCPTGRIISVEVLKQGALSDFHHRRSLVC